MRGAKKSFRFPLHIIPTTSDNMAQSSETSWRDNADIQKEIEENNQWSGDLKLPPRSTRVRFHRVPDFNDADFDWSNPEGMFVPSICGVQRPQSRRRHHLAFFLSDCASSFFAFGSVPRESWTHLIAYFVML